MVGACLRTSAHVCGLASTLHRREGHENMFVQLMGNSTQQRRRRPVVRRLCCSGYGAVDGRASTL